MESLQTAAQVKMLNSMVAGGFTRARQPFGGTVVWSWWRAIAVDFNYMHPSCGPSKTTADRHDGPSKITAKIRSHWRPMALARMSRDATLLAVNIGQCVTGLSWDSETDRTYWCGRVSNTSRDLWIVIPTSQSSMPLTSQSHIFRVSSSTAIWHICTEAGKDGLRFVSFDQLWFKEFATFRFTIAVTILFVGRSYHLAEDA